MNPDETLREMREAIDAWNEAADGRSADAEHEAAAVVAALASALDTGLRRGGRLPREWERK